MALTSHPIPKTFSMPDTSVEMSGVTELGEDIDTQRTPTNDTFAAMARNRVSADSPTSPPDTTTSNNSKRADLERKGSNHSTASTESQDVKMDDDEDEADGSDNEDAMSDSGRPTKKKKGQRFYCTEYPPCQLSFTRSEHLARHIRKHTGERPFQCHCLRKFSRLDNLRQHAQTVHVNEDIPGDSLAATGTRFQRQIRTDRMRPQGARPRGSTVGSISHSRGHSRNLSTSSIGSIVSASDFALPDERRRPPLLAPSAPRSGLTIDTTTQYGSQYYNPSPTGYSTPTSVFSGDQNSPRMAVSGLQSPQARGHAWAERPASRRLSIPSSSNSYQPGHSYNSSNASVMSPITASSASTISNLGSGFASPATSVFSTDTHRDSAAEASWRRRTWHTETYVNGGYRPATSGLRQYSTSQSTFEIAQPASSVASQSVRLPSIASFLGSGTSGPLRRPMSPMDIDQPSPPGSQDYRKTVEPGTNSARHSWSSSVDGQISNLDTPQRTFKDPVPPSRHAYSRSESSVRSLFNPASSAQAIPNRAQMPAPSSLGPILSGEPGPQIIEGPPTPRKKKREAWYNGPLPDHQPIAVRTSPEGSSGSESIATPLTMYASEPNPAIRHSNGYVETHPPGTTVEEISKAWPAAVREQPVSGAYHQPALSSPAETKIYPFHPLGPSVPRTGGHDTGRFDALVAVATSEDQGVTTR